MATTPVWQRKAGKNPKGGLNEAGRRSLKAEGHDIKRPQPEGGSRRDSFCARMKGMKAKLTSSETARDPDSRINKSLRAWNCADGGAIRPELAGGGDALKAAMKLAQQITSAKTSVNQVPGLFKSQLLEALPSHRNLDIGGGKYDTGTDFLKSRGIESHVYDPFNRPAEHNEAVMSRFKENPADSVTIANVLNVIREPEARQAVIQQALDALRPGGKAYFSVYEGNRSGAGAETPKGWQENRKALEYLDEIKKHFPEAQRKGDIIYGSRPEMGAGGDALKALIQSVMENARKLPRHERMAAVHGMDVYNLSKLEKLGGIPNPSIAITNPMDNTRIGGFGNLHLVAKPEVINPAETPVFSADIYSPRFPRTKEEPSYDKRIITSEGKEIPLTLENVSAEMNSRPIRGGEYYDPEMRRITNYGSSTSIAANLARQFKDFNDLQASRDLLKGSQKSHNILQDLTGDYRQLARELNEHTSNEILQSLPPEDLSKPSITPGSQYLLEAIKSGDLQKYYPTAPSNLLDRVGQLKSSYETRPVPYFEAKPNRPIMNNEWAGALLSRHLENAYGPTLERMGIKLHTYDPDKMAPGMALLKHFEPQTFDDGGTVRPEMGAGGSGLKAALNLARNIIKTYHGSPHQFDKFDLDKLGSGVGAQAYGHGLYTSDNPNVARNYRTVTPGRLPNFANPAPNEITIGGKPVYSVYKDIERQANNVPIAEAGKYYDKLDVLERLMHEGDALAIKQAASDEAFSPEAYKWFQTNIEPKLNTPGGLYEINLHADPKSFIDLYSQISLKDPLRERVESLAQHGLQNADAQAAYRDAQEAMKTVKRKDIFGSDIQGALDTLLETKGSNVRQAAGVSPDIKGPEAVARYLNREGYAGFTYPHGLDAPGPETLNRVVFDPKVMEIVKRYADGGRIHFDEGGLARIEELIRQAKGEEAAKEASHPVGMSGNVEFAPVEINEPMTGSKIPLGSLPTPTAAVVNPVANALAQYGPYAAGPIPAGLAAARDLVTGLKEGSGLDVATAALGAPGKALKYGLPALGAVTDIMSPTEAQAGAGSKIIKGLSSLALRNPEILRAEHPYFPEGFRDKIAGIVSPFSNDEDIAKHAVEMAQKYRTSLENKSGITGGYYGPIQSVDPLNVTRKIKDIPGINLLPTTPQQTYEDLYKVGKGGTLINLAGDRSDFGRLTHIGGNKLEFPVDLHAGPKYMLEPNPGETWANAPEHAGKLQKKVSAAEKKGPVIGLYTPMGAQSVSSSQHMFDALMAQMKGSGASKSDMENFDAMLRKGEHFLGDAKNKKNAIEYMKGWPGLANAKEAAKFARNLPGHHRAAIVNEMEKARWKKLGFPEVGVTRVAVTDPQMLSTSQNLMGGRAATLSTKNPKGADPLFQHSTYGSPTYGQYLMELPFVQRQYAMPEAIKKYTKPTETGTVVHPFSQQSLGRGSFRKLFETNFLTQPINQQWLDTLMTGLERQKQYGFNRGGKAS